jgi:Domain of unknown function (DUF4780)
MIEGQNEDLDTGNWKVLNRTEEKTCLALTMEVDQTSYERLSKRNFQVEFEFGQKVKLNPRKKVTGKKSDPKGPPKQVVQHPAEPQPSTFRQNVAFGSHGEPQQPKSKKKRPKSPISSKR